MVVGVYGRGGCMEGGHVWQEGCMARGVHGKRGAWQEGCMAGSMHGRGACVAGDMHSGGGIHGSGCAWWGVCMAEGACVAGGGACVAGEMATAVDGTHPTGMHSCSYLLMFLPLIAVRYFPDSVNSKAIWNYLFWFISKELFLLTPSCFLEITLSIKCFFTPMALMFS